MQVLALCKIVLVEVDDFSTNTIFNHKKTPPCAFDNIVPNPTWRCFYLIPIYGGHFNVVPAFFIIGKKRGV